MGFGNRSYEWVSWVYLVGVFLVNFELCCLFLFLRSFEFGRGRYRLFFFSVSGMIGVIELKVKEGCDRRGEV